MLTDEEPQAEGLEKLIDELSNQIAHLERSSAELQSLLDAGRDVDGGAELAEEDRAVYADAVAENRRALESKRAHLEELRRMRGGVSL